MENTKGNEDDLNSWRRCVKVEWGSFGDYGDLQSISTIYDQKVDKESEKRGIQCFEKMVSLTYVGEIVRHVLLANDRLILHDGNHSKLQEKYCLKPGDILKISKDPEGKFRAQELLTSLGFVPTDQDCDWMKRVCDAVFCRSASLCGAGLAAVIEHIQKKHPRTKQKVTVGVDGLLYKTFPKYRQDLQQTVKKLCKGCHVKLETPNYGPEIGTALVTAIAKRTKDNRKKIKKLLEQLKLPFEILQEIQARLRQEMERGLVEETRKNAILKMFPTFICQKPEKEQGEYIVLEFGDKDINIMYVTIGKGEQICLGSLWLKRECPPVRSTVKGKGIGSPEAELGPLGFGSQLDSAGLFGLKGGVSEQVPQRALLFGQRCQNEGQDGVHLSDVGRNGSWKLGCQGIPLQCLNCFVTLPDVAKIAPLQSNMNTRPYIGFQQVCPVEAHDLCRRPTSILYFHPGRGGKKRCPPNAQGGRRWQLPRAPQTSLCSRRARELSSQLIGSAPSPAARLTCSHRTTRDRDPPPSTPKEGQHKTRIHHCPPTHDSSPATVKRPSTFLFLCVHLSGYNYVSVSPPISNMHKSGVKSGACSSSPLHCKLFDHIAQCLLDFQETENLSGKKAVSFIFSFPCEQTGLKKAKLTQWTKGIEATGCVGKNVVDLLQKAINKKEMCQKFEGSEGEVEGLKMSQEVIALANDTTGTMMSCCFHDPSCEIGMIAGEGTNACYMENKDNIETVRENEGQMCVNMEWGAFGDNGSLDDIFTSYDKEVDRLSINPGKQRYEKMIGGMYLGEIVRQALISINKEVPFNQDKQSNILQNENLLSLEDICEIEKDELSMAQLNSVLLQRGLGCTSDGALLVKEVCRAVSQRAAQLCAAGIAAVVEKIHENCQDERKISVGVTGSLYTEHPHFARNLTKTLKNLIPDKEVNFKTSDGHGIGAALIASVAEKKLITL
ncbi:hexokinase HKDC1 [Pelobates cultripes]|uniref:hexokinase n=2 Tax=Pelobates cultripes TaxID=61616 RepID=A0AAD1VXP1_PELCU|nr:hexokinase HKDC1 [Pelobates cultripes]